MSNIFFLCAQRTKRQAPNINVHQIPKTGFSCTDRRVGEYYADPEANCQVYHVCIPGMHNKMSLMSFVCPNGTIFSQATRVCTPYERVDCSLTSQFYENVHGGANSRRNYESDNDYENYVPQPPPRETAQPPRQSSRSRNTPAPPPPPREVPAQPPRNTRFRSGTNQFRGQQAPPATTAAPARTTTTAAPARAPARPAPPAFRPPVPARPAQPAGLSNVLPPRPTPRGAISTSTSSYSYDYEYDYEYEDDAPAAEQGNARSKREAIPADDYDQTMYNFEENYEKTGFNCQDKVAGGVYADIESNCEMFHICVPLGKYKMLDYKVFCANGTAFDQETGSCREKEEFNCENAHLYYQFEKPNQPASSKKPVLKKKKHTKSKKGRNLSKE